MSIEERPDYIPKEPEPDDAELLQRRHDLLRSLKTEKQLLDRIAALERQLGEARERVIFQNTDIKLLQREVEALRADAERISEAYGWLWCVNEEPGTPNRFPAEQAAYNARKLLRDMLTHEQRGVGINKAVIARNDALDALAGGE